MYLAPEPGYGSHEALPVTRLRPLAGDTSKRRRKHQLIGMVAAMAC